MTMALYHIITESSLDEAEADGLRAVQGEVDHRNEDEHGVFLFNSEANLEYALENYLSESFPEDEALAILKIDDADLDRSALMTSDGVFDVYFPGDLAANTFEVDWVEPAVKSSRNGVMKP